MTALRNAAFDHTTPLPPATVEIVPGVAALAVTGDKGLSTGFYALVIPVAADAARPSPVTLRHRTPGGDPFRR
ncbi:hypothetical protein [Streptomyces sp. IBSBF 2435]|uniref:hypothetical protein n=1 Tax=Streptomyces sp. IBSBF 2435 TaxID=2903531 RepID=UPI002FDC188F